MSWALLSGAVKRIWHWIEDAVRSAAALPEVFKAVKEIERELTYREFEEAARQVEMAEAVRQGLELRFGMANLIRPEEEALWIKKWSEWSLEQKRMAEEERLIERAVEEPRRMLDIIPDDLCLVSKYVRPGYYNITLKYKILDAISGEETEGFWSTKLFGAPSLQRAISNMLSSMEACESPPCLENKILLGASFYRCLRGG